MQEGPPGRRPAALLHKGIIFTAALPRKPVEWVGSSRKDIQALPFEVRRVFGDALNEAQKGDKHPTAEPLHGFGGANVLEVVEDCQTDTYRAVYTVRFAEAVYVLHVFQKKAKQGAKTPARDLSLIHTRLIQAEELHRQYTARKKE